MKKIFLLLCFLVALISCASKKPCVPGNPHDWKRLQEELKAKGEEYNPDDYDKHCYDNLRYYYPPPEPPPEPKTESGWCIGPWC